MTDEIDRCSWPTCRRARGLAGCVSWCKCRCHNRAQQTEKAQNEVWVVETPRGATETFTERTIQTLVALGLIEHDHDGYALQDGAGNGVGPLHHYFVGRAND